MKYKLLLITLLITINSNAQIPGTLDNSFGINGQYEYTVTVGTTLYGIIANDSYTLPNGKILIVGVASSGCSSNSSYSGIMARFNSDGTFDTSFNQTGFKLTSTENFRQIIPVADDSFYILSYTKILKVDPQGNLDNSFGNNGVVNLTQFNKAFKIDSQGNFIVLSKFSSSSTTHYLKKITSVGNIDLTFGNNGFYQFDFAYRLNTLLLDSNDNIYVTGQDNTSSTAPKLIVAKLTNNGDLYNTFGVNGVFKLNTYVISRGFLINFDSQNQLIVAGDGNYLGNLGLILLKINTNGILDNTFNSSGYLHKPISSESTPSKLHITNDGNLYVLGTGWFRMYIAKFNGNGTSDSDFGTNGYVLTENVSSIVYCKSSEINDNNIIVVGAKSFTHCNQTKYKLTLSKYFIEDETLSIEDQEMSQITLYPNPFIDKIRINTGGKAYKVKMFDINGKEMPIHIDSDVITTTLLTKGIYLLKININDKSKYYKIIKH
ncbi:T9SS type A sorting domain-containing protein [Tenacibaculum sp. ZS6-P6]|uniref:T9SS type A sorting domain-containing protein n=1 Tax=Tenacibaculum sp. ZS6-P6 TaxID=3447503 RepID=UPI003F9AEC1F